MATKAEHSLLKPMDRCDWLVAASAICYWLFSLRSSEE